MTPPESDPDREVIAAIAADIEKLAKEFPQLAQFDVKTALNRDNLSVSYGYHTHEPRHRGGWTSGVPNPDDDGIWFYIDLHDPKSMSQIHTQPMIRCQHMGSKRVSFLLLEGPKTKSVAGRLQRILDAHGAVPCKDD